MDTCIFVTAVGRLRPTTRKDEAQLTVNFSVQIGAVSKSTVAKTSPIILDTSNTTFQLPLDADDALRRRLISTAISTLDIPFPMPQREKSILWGTLTFPEESQPAFVNLDEIKSRLCHALRGCADTGYMHVVIRKVDMVSEEDYKKLLDRENRKEGVGQSLSFWIRENENNLVNLNMRWCMELLHNLSFHSPRDNKWFGLRSVRVEEERGEHDCSICLKVLKKGSEVIRMPCLHLFHGFCIFGWIRLNSSCPICRSDLKLDRKLLLS